MRRSPVPLRPVAAWLLPFATGAPVSAQVVDEPILVNGSLVYPEGAAIPKWMTPTESAYIETRPLEAMRGTTPPPEGPIYCPAEYEPMQGILIAWESFTSTLALMAAHITTTGNADIYVMCDTASEANTARNAIDNVVSPEANMSRVFTFVAPTDTVWIRDYGPRYIYEGSIRAVIDHTYNRPRPNDDAQPSFWANAKKHPRYEIPLIHGGGNFHLSGLGLSHATGLIQNENPMLTPAQIHGYWLDYQNLDTSIETPFPQYIDFTQHIDMWMEIIGDQAAVISQWAASPPVNPGDPDPKQVCDDVAAALQVAGWTIHRTPAFYNTSSGVHYTFTNVVICNDLVIVPSYTNPIASGSNATALATWQAAMPGKTCVALNGESIAALAGVFHCIMMHVPAPLGGNSPTVYLRSPRGPETLEPGSMVDIRWSTDDDVGVSNVDILYSTDGGTTFPNVIASATADDGLFAWSVPIEYTNQGRIKVMARDADSHTGFDSSSSDLIIHCLGDANADHSIDFDDVISILANWSISGGPFTPGDGNGDGTVNFDDVTTTLANWGAVCP